MQNNKEEFENHLNQVCHDLCNFPTFLPMDENDMKAFQEKLVIVLPCGGESKRMSGLAQTKHKTALAITNEDTMVTRMIKFYASFGMKRFVLLVGVHASSIIESTNECCRNLDVEIKYSLDPGKPVGRGGAILHAIENKTIPSGYSMVIHNADDQILGYPGNFLNDICRAHLTFAKAGDCVTSIVALTSPFPYTAFTISAGKVIRMACKPRIPIPAHIGISIISSGLQERFYELFDYQGKKDFEEYLFPILLKEEKLYAFGIPGQCWYPVNTPKEYEALISAIRSSNSSTSGE